TSTMATATATPAGVATTSARSTTEASALQESADPQVAPTVTSAPPPGNGGEASSAAPETGRALDIASMPPVDDDHIELGALATLEPGERTKLDDINFTLDTDLPSLDRNASAYHFSTPFVDPRIILRSAGQFLGINEEPQVEDDEGRTMYKLSSEGSDTTFTWFPASGAFSCTIKHSEPGNQVEDITAAAVEWLRDFGFPVNTDEVRPVIKTSTDGERTVEVPLGTMPDPAIGHPMSVSLIVDEYGRIIRASGYWIQVTDVTTVPLLSASESWDALQAGVGYWPDRPAGAAGGEFSVSDFGISYVLTLDDEQEGLVLQPVVRATGTFRPVNGDPIESSIYLQAVADDGES
ncbi:MAG: hypothetical protein ACOC9Y_05065, partial [Chloroflexota bacterium]